MNSPDRHASAPVLPHADPSPPQQTAPVPATPTEGAAACVDIDVTVLDQSTQPPAGDVSQETASAPSETTSDAPVPAATPPARRPGRSQFSPEELDAWSQRWQAHNARTTRQPDPITSQAKSMAGHIRALLRETDGIDLAVAHDQLAVQVHHASKQVRRIIAALLAADDARQG
jgi:hypothetical protein